MSGYQVAAISATVAKKAQGFIAANARQSCNKCVKGEEQREDRMPPYDTAHWYCTLGGFRTTAKSVCEKYVARKGGAA